MKTSAVIPILFAILSPIAVQAASFVVSPGQSLQAAIDAAAAGDNITVQTGTYNENIAITKGVDIRGAGGAVVVTGTLAVTNAVLPVYVADVSFGKAGASGITFTGTGTQNVRMDRCKLLGGGDLTSTGTVAYFYKHQFDGAIAFTTSTWTFQRCTVAGNLTSTNSTAKCIASTVTGTFAHSGASAGEITLFQSNLTGQADITLPVGQSGWINYSTLSSLNLVGGSLEITGNHIIPVFRSGYVIQIGSGCNAMIRNNHILGDGRGKYPNIWVFRDIGSNVSSNLYTYRYYYGSITSTLGSISHNSDSLTPSWFKCVRNGNLITKTYVTGSNPESSTASTTNPFFWMTDGTTLATAKYAIMARGTMSAGAVAISVLNGAGSVRIFNNTVLDVTRFVTVAASPGGVEIRGNIHRVYTTESESLLAYGVNSWMYRELIAQGIPEADVLAGKFMVVDASGTAQTLLAYQSVGTSYTGTIISDNNLQYNVIGGQVSNNVNVDPGLVIGTDGSVATLGNASASRETGPADALFNDIDGTRNDQGAYGGHSYDPTGRTTLKPVVLSGDINPLYVKRGGAVTIKARAAVSAAP
jgi:hypothetical protein